MLRPSHQQNRRKSSDPHHLQPLRSRVKRLGVFWLVWVNIGWGGLTFIGCEEGIKPLLPQEVIEQTRSTDVIDAPPLSSPVSPMLRPPKREECPEGSEEVITPNVIRRLTRFEYERTLHTLIGVDVTSITQGFPPEEEVLGFDNQARSLQISALHVEQYMQAAEQLASITYDRLNELDLCVPMSVEDIECVYTILDDFGSRVWRRPLTATEREKLLRVFHEGVDGAHMDLVSPDVGLLGPIDPIRDGVTLMISALLQSPHFLYRVEVGRVEIGVFEKNPDDEQNTQRKLTGYEIASRLSYLLWRSMPDEELFNAASIGTLDTAEGVLAQAERMMLDPQASDGLWSFFEQWLALDEVEEIDKDTTRFPTYTHDLNLLLSTEARMFVEEVIFQEGDMRTLFDGSFSFQNNSLATHYVAGGEGAELTPDQYPRSLEWAKFASDGQEVALPSDSTFERVELNPLRRSGLLTRGAVLALTTKPNQGDPVHRGLYVRERLLCTPLPPPPPDIVVVAPDPDPSLTTREQFAIHSEDPLCAGCHNLVDPLGFGLERFDPVGRWRNQENQKDIDDHGEITATLDINGTFKGSQELAAQLATSEQVQRCVVLQFFRYAHGRAEVAEERCGINTLYQEYESDQYDFLTLLRALVTSPTFRYRYFDDNDQSEE